MHARSGGQRRGRGMGSCVGSTKATMQELSPHDSQRPLPPSVVDALDLALADERLALATYQTVLARFGDIRPFVNIARAEQRHIDALLAVYAHYDVHIPVSDLTVDPATHTMDIAGLCQLGVTAEIENVRLYDEDLLPNVVAYADISAVLTALRNASANNHLPAFARCASRRRDQTQKRN